MVEAGIFGFSAMHVISAPLCSCFGVIVMVVLVWCSPRAPTIQEKFERRKGAVGWMMGKKNRGREKKKNNCRLLRMKGWKAEVGMKQCWYSTIERSVKSLAIEVPINNSLRSGSESWTFEDCFLIRHQNLCELTDFHFSRFHYSVHVLDFSQAMIKRVFRGVKSIKKKEGWKKRRKWEKSLSRDWVWRTQRRSEKVQWSLDDESN